MFISCPVLKVSVLHHCITFPFFEHIESLQWVLFVCFFSDSLPWVELMSSRRKLWVTHDVEIIKVAGQNVGLTFKEVSADCKGNLVDCRI